MLEQFAGFQNGFNWYYIKKDDVKISRWNGVLQSSFEATCQSTILCRLSVNTKKLSLFAITLFKARFIKFSFCIMVIYKAIKRLLIVII